jgi:thiamine biosynthesis lipoprotein
MAAELHFTAMGSDVHVIVVGGHPSLPGRARRRLGELERRWSRFLSDSEITGLNAAGGRARRVSADTRTLVRKALVGHFVTGGAFDPTLLGAIRRVGYDRSFELLDVRAVPHPSCHLRSGADEIELDDDRGTVRIPAGVGFDPGGLGKGLAADLVAEELIADGAEGACVNVGGDLRVTGAAPDGGGWRVGVDDPGRGGSLALLSITAGGIATSSQTERRWTDPSGAGHHHLIDPVTACSAESEVLTVTVTAAEAWQAEVLTKAAILADGVDEGLATVERLGAAALAVTRSSVRTTGTWARFTVPVVEAAR